MVKRVQYVAKITKYRCIVHVSIHSVTAVYILILQVTAILQNLVWASIVQFALNTFYILMQTNPEKWAKCFPENFILKKWTQSSLKCFVKGVYVKVKNMPHISV